MRITVVIENAAPTGAALPFAAEHGLAMLLEINGKKLLVDTGQTGNVVRNLALLQVHPRDIDAIILSHGHYDHTGGLAEVLKHRDRSVPVYAHPAIFQERYITKGDIKRAAGLPFPRSLLTSLGADWQLHETPFEIMPELWFSGHIPRQTEFEIGDTHLILTDEHQHCCQDTIADDAVLYYTKDNELTVIAGCAHSGLANIARYGLKLTGAARLKGWIGGTHLGPVAQDQKEQTLAFIEEQNVDLLAANHCTGFEVMCALRQRLGSRFIPAFVGAVIEY